MTDAKTKDTEPSVELTPPPFSVYVVYTQHNRGAVNAIAAYRVEARAMAHATSIFQAPSDGQSPAQLLGIKHVQVTKLEVQ